jgi:putative DNA primase/helicase
MSDRPKLTATTGAVDAIPRELRELPQWVGWRRERRNGKWTKAPYQAARPARRARRASTTDPATWSSFEEARAAFETGAGDGIGFVFTADDPYAGVDLDDCFDELGRFDPAGAAIVRRLDSYTELSPSGRGVHVIVRGRLDGSRHRTGETPWRGKLEVYDQTRFFTISGQRLSGASTTIEPRQAELEAVLAHHLPPPTATATTTPPPAPDVLALDDEQLLAKARRSRNGAHFQQLWTGDIAGYASASEADLALCGSLAFWTGGDPIRIDALFRRSGLFRAEFRAEKWDRLWSKESGDTYGSRTIDLAIRRCRSFYDPHANVRRILAAATLEEALRPSDGR